MGSILTICTVLLSTFAEAPPNFDPEAISRQALPAVLVILGTRADDGNGVQGSGVAVSTEGHVLATAHQVEGVQKLRGRFSDGTEIMLEPLEIDPARELALLKAAGVLTQTAHIGDATALDGGAPLVSIAAPRGLDFSTVTGTVAHPRRSVRGFPVMQLTMPATHGSSGGPVFDRRARLVGLITGELPDSDFTIVTHINNAYPMLRRHGVSVPESPLPDQDEMTLEPSEGISPTEARALDAYNRGVTSESLAEKAEAYALAAKLLPNFFRAWFNLGVVRAALGDAEGAEAAYLRAIEIDASALIAHRNLGLLYLSLKRSDEAVAVFRAALELAPEAAQLHNDLGEALRQRNDLEGAEAAFRKAIERDDTYAAAHFNLGLALGAGEKHAEAVTHFEKYLALQPDADDASQVREIIESLKQDRK